MQQPPQSCSEFPKTEGSGSSTQLQGLVWEPGLEETRVRVKYSCLLGRHKPLALTETRRVPPVPWDQSPALTHSTLLTPALADNSASGFHGFQAV